MKNMLMLFLTLGFLNYAQAQEPSNKIVGNWVTDDNAFTIEIYQADGSFSGKVVGISELDSNPNLDPKDTKNPNPKLRDRSILGMDIITGLKYSGGKWVNGTIYAPKKGIYADCNIELLSNGELKVIVSKSGFTKTKIWTPKL